MGATSQEKKYESCYDCAGLLERVFIWSLGDRKVALSADPEFVLPGVPVNTTAGREPELHCVTSHGRDVLGGWLGVGSHPGLLPRAETRRYTCDSLRVFTVPTDFITGDMNVDGHPNPTNISQVSSHLAR